MKAVICLDVPEWQIGQPVTVYFPDTMVKHSTCELYFGRKSKTRYTLYRKGISEPLVIKGSAQECANVMGCSQKNYVYIMLSRHKGENGKWKIEKTVID